MIDFLSKNTYMYFKYHEGSLKGWEHPLNSTSLILISCENITNLADNTRFMTTTLYRDTYT